MSTSPDLNHCTSRANGEIGIIWVDPATGTPTGCPPMIPWVCEVIIPTLSRTGPPKVSESVNLYGYSILNLKSQKRNLVSNIYWRRLFYRKPSDCRAGAPLPFNAVDPRTVAPGIPGLRAAVIVRDAA